MPTPSHPRTVLRTFAAAVLLAALPGPARAAAPIGSAEAIRIIRQVGPEGAGNTAASAAVHDLALASASSIVPILAGMDGANPLAMNWLRAAVESIVAREIAAGRPLPIPTLEAFVRDTGHNPRARRLAYDLILQADPARAETILGTMLDDPANELRRDAVQRIVADANRLRDAKDAPAAVARYQAALTSARDVDQIEAIAKSLKDLGKPVDLPAVFGWVNRWRAIGPFDNTRGAGYETVFPPETKLDFSAELDGKLGKVRWVPVVSTNEYGLVDLNAPLGKLKEVTGYAVTELRSDSARPVEIRLGCKNGWKLWLNGEFLFGRDEYHRGIEIDQYRLKATLKPGTNVLLVKLCQNEMVEDWTVEWEFQLRITDELGTPVPLALP